MIFTRIIALLISLLQRGKLLYFTSIFKKMENSEKFILILTLTYIHIIKQKLFSLGGAVKIKI